MMVCSTGAGSAEPGRLDDDAAKTHAAVVEAAQELLQRVHQVAAHRAAQAPGREQHHAVLDVLDEEMIDADLAENSLMITAVRRRARDRAAAG